MSSIYNPAAIVGGNIIHNGDFLVDQANEGGTPSIATGTSIRSADRWFAAFTTSASGAGTPTITQQTSSSGAPAQFNKSLLLTCSGTAGTSTTAGLTGTVSQSIEGIDIPDLSYGGASAKALTLTGWLKSSIASATITVSLQNSANNRSYPISVSVPSAATWTQFSVQIPGDILGTWLIGMSQVGLRVIVAFAGGSTFQGTGSTWQGGNFNAVAAQTQYGRTASATLEMTGFKLERGGAATQFVPDQISVALEKYRRYYRKSFPLGTAPAQTGGVAGAISVKNPIALGDPSAFVSFDPVMYDNPTFTTFNPSAGNANWRNLTAAADATVSVDPGSTKTTTGVLIATSGTVTTLGDILAIHYTAASSI